MTNSQMALFDIDKLSSNFRSSNNTPLKNPSQPTLRTNFTSPKMGGAFTMRYTASYIGLLMRSCEGGALVTKAAFQKMVSVPEEENYLMDK